MATCLSRQASFAILPRLPDLWRRHACLPAGRRLEFERQSEAEIVRLNFDEDFVFFDFNFESGLFHIG